MNIHTLSELVNIYILRCEVEGKSPATVTAYRWTLGRFLRALSEDDAPTAPGSITREHLYLYLGRFVDHSADTRHRYYREVRCFFNWLVDSGYIEKSPFQGMKNIRLPQRIVQPYSAEEVSILLDSCGETEVGTRDRAMIMTLLDTGLRCSEIVQIDLADVDFESRRIKVRFGKGNKQRVVPFAESCSVVLATYLDRRGLEPGPLFYASNTHGALSNGIGLKPNGLKQMLRRLGRKTGIKKVHAHRFRHTFATWAIEHDARELDVQYLLGHSSSDMVRRYSSSYRSEQAAMRHVNFSPADQMLV